jgi:ABC-type Fe3+ transport system substrate-binding protein
MATTSGLWVIFTTKWGEDGVTDYLKKLVNDQQARIVARSSEIVPALTTGDLSIGIVSRTNALDSMEKGAPIAFSTGDIIANSGTLIGVPVNGKHPNAAKLYISWLVTEEGQTAYDKATHRGLVSVPGTWAYENRDKLKVVEWPLGDFDKYNQIASDLDKIFPKH